MDEPDHANNIFMVEKLVDRRWRRGRTEYLVKWLNYDESENTWEPRANINHLLCDQYDSECGGPMNGPPSKSPASKQKTPQKRRSGAVTPSPTSSASPAKRTRGLEKKESVPTPPSSRRSTRRGGTASSVTNESIEPTPTPEPESQPELTSEKEEAKPNEEKPEASTSDEQTSEPPQPPPVPIVEEPVEEPKLQQPVETPPEKEKSKDQNGEQAKEEEIKSPTIELVTTKPYVPIEKLEDPPESFIEEPEEEKSVEPTPPEPEKQPGNTYSYIVPTDAPNQPEMVHVYENIPQSSEVPPADSDQPFPSTTTTQQPQPQTAPTDGDTQTQV